MEIFLLRHAIAIERAEHDGPDEERPLTEEGRRELKRVARAMRTMGLSFDVIFSSPLVRALQTAEIVAASLRLKNRLQVTDRLAPSMPAGKQIAWLNRLRPSPDSVLLVGHEPNLSEFTSHLLTGGRLLIINFRKAGLCKVATERIAAGSATLEWLLTPKQMRRMR
jgi:phosphohistidine phosphatase